MYGASVDGSSTCKKVPHLNGTTKHSCNSFDLVVVET